MSVYLGWWNLFSALVALKGTIKDSRERVNKEGEANTLNVDPKVFPLFAEEDTVG